MLVGGVATGDRFRGCLLGLAAGDVLGTALEFERPGAFEPIGDMVGGGPFGLEPGQWTDDTSMALCLAESLIESGGFDAADQMRRYLRWRDAGYLPSRGYCFDIGNTVKEALFRFAEDGSNPYAGSSDPLSAENGSRMRLGPVPMYFAGDAAEASAGAPTAPGQRTQRRKPLTHAATSAACLSALCVTSASRRSSPPSTAPWKASGRKARWQRGSLLSPTGRSNTGSPRRSEGLLRRGDVGGGAVGVPQVPGVP